jgi:hypothetical protein
MITLNVETFEPLDKNNYMTFETKIGLKQLNYGILIKKINILEVEFPILAQYHLATPFCLNTNPKLTSDVIQANLETEGQIYAYPLFV